MPDASYKEGTACHLDISQWATIPVCGKMNKAQKTSLVSEKDIEIIRSLIQFGSYDYLLLNCKTTSEDILKNFFNVDHEVCVLKPTPDKITVYYSEISELLGHPLEKKIKIFGWNRYIQRGLRKENRELIRNWIQGKMR